MREFLTLFKRSILFGETYNHVQWTSWKCVILQLLQNREDHSDETDHFEIEEGNDQTLFKKAVITWKYIRSTWIATSEKLSPAQETPILLDSFSQRDCRLYRDKGLTAVFSFSVAGIHNKERRSIKKTFCSIFGEQSNPFFLVLLRDVSSYDCVRKFPAFKEFPYEVTGKKSLPRFTVIINFQL